MPSVWQYFCCLCDKKNDKRQISARYKRSSRRHNSRGIKSGKNTWARRSLLDNEQTELEEVPKEQIAYQMRAISTPTYDSERAGGDRFQERILEQFVPKKRPTVYDVFEKYADAKPTSKTTFPWMDERFVPNARNGTRLGISSVQMNAKRNEAAMKRNNTNPNVSKDQPHAFTPYTKSQSFTGGQGTKGVGNHAPVLSSNYFQVKARNIQNGHVLQSNINAAPKAVTNVTRPVRLGISSNFTEKPIILKAPTSDVGVRRISSNTAQHSQDRIPKLEDYTSVSGAKIVAHEKTDVKTSRPNVMDIFPNTGLTKNENGVEEDEADLSYSSEVIFRKQPSEYSGSDVSLKRSAAPGMFSSKTSKYERLKPERSRSQISKPEKSKSKSKYSNLSGSESMYGYVPKAVQNVHASNALEGTKIDDFFMQKMHEDQLENFGSFGNVSNSEEEPVIITTVVESLEDLTITGKGEVDHVKTEITEQIVPFGGTARVSDEDLATGADNKAKIVNCSDGNLKPTIKESVSNTKTLTEESNQEKVSNKDENENKVIMIDFPPNLENDKFKTTNNLKKSPSNSQKSNKSTVAVKPETAGEVLY